MIVLGQRQQCQKTKMQASLSQGIIKAAPYSRIVPARPNETRMITTACSLQVSRSTASSVIEKPSVLATTQHVACIFNPGTGWKCDTFPSQLPGSAVRPADEVQRLVTAQCMPGYHKRLSRKNLPKQSAESRAKGSTASQSRHGRWGKR